MFSLSTARYQRTASGESTKVRTDGTGARQSHRRVDPIVVDGLVRIELETKHAIINIQRCESVRRVRTMTL